jgi:hypothetical protein
MTNASAMTLTLVLFLGLFLAATFIILSGGGWSAYHDRRKSRAQRPGAEERRRAA